MSSSNHEKWLELAEIYAVNALDGAELSEFESHLASGCEFCQAHLFQTEEILGSAAQSYALVNPPAFLKEKILDLAQEPAAALVKPRPAVSWAFAGIGMWAFASIIIILGWNLSKTRKEMHELGTLITLPSAQIMEMKGMEQSPKAAGRVIRDSETNRCFFMAMGLAPVPAGKVYELWAIKGSDPVPMGTFRVDEHGCAMLNLSSFQGMDSFEKFAVTLEPSGGVPKPTGPMHLLGSL